MNFYKVCYPETSRNTYGLLSSDINIYKKQFRQGNYVWDWQSLTLDLVNGAYPDVEYCQGLIIISPELKELFDSFLGNDDSVEYFPVNIQSDEYGNKVYYAVHFKSIPDVIDYDNSLYIGNDVVVADLIYDKVENLSIFYMYNRPR